MKSKIVLVTDSREPSGLGAHMITLGRALAGQFDITIACQNDPAGMAFLQRAARAGLRIKAYDPDEIWQFGQWLRQARTSLLHVHAGIGWEGHDLVRCGKAAGVPVVRTEHLPYLLTSVVQQAEYRAMLKSVDGRIAVSHAAFASVDGQSDRPHSVVRNGIAPRVAERDTTRAAFGLSDADTVVLTVARFTVQKGYDVLVTAAPTVLHEYPDAKFVLVGTGPEFAGIAAQIEDAGLSANFLLLGERDDVPELMAIADVFVLPSRFEGLPLAVLEAMAAGVPVVATAIGGTTEAIGDRHPFLVAPDDAAALAAALLQVLEGSPQAQQSIADAKARFAEQFTAERMAEQTAQVYAPLLFSNL